MNGPTTIHRFGMWQIPYKASGVICPDGKRRTVRLSDEADTFWTMPARLSYKGTTVSGFVTAVDDIFDCGQQFIPTGKNQDLFEYGIGSYRHIKSEYVEEANMSVLTGTHQIRVIDHETGKEVVVLESFTGMSADNLQEMHDNRVFWVRYRPEHYRRLVQEV